MNVAVVILNWNGERFLRRFLPKVVANSQVKGVEVVVADNGSTDGSLELLRKDFPSVRLIEFDTNYGFAGGYNRALFQIDARYFVLLNSDVEVPEGWLDPLIRYMDLNPNVAACAPKIMDFSNSERFEYAGAAGGFIDWLGYPFCRGRMLSVLEKDEGQYDSIRDVFWASGACMFVRADVFKEVGGFDDLFFAHMEEIDLCWRFINKEYRVVSVPTSKVFHVGGGTLPNNNPFKLYLNYRNSLFMLHKNLHKHDKCKVITIRLALDFMSALVYLLTFRYKYFSAVIKAHRHYFKGRKSLNAYRAIASNKPISEIKQILRKGILLEFFILRRKKFSDLKL
ncbi:MAG TPA: glycosyltransferase family 2 protein [Tenuifilaceae bacterium]|nr:glycosyltransferase family 2 protein [Tenuifilaceae bacterium]